jgi:hypothetical protein
MMRTGWLIIPAVVLALVVGGAIGAAVVNHDDDRGSRVVQVTAPPSESGQAPQVITIDDGNGRWGHGGFFPFGFLFPLLWIGLIIVLISAFFRRGGRGGPGRWGGGPGGWSRDWNAGMDDWHRRQHEGDKPSAPGPAASA